MTTAGNQPVRPVFIGTAGWSIRSTDSAIFAGNGSQLTRYATRLNAAEINSSFYRPHRRSTYERWADSVPEGFRFSVKLPKTITHEHRLGDCNALLDRFLAEVQGLGPKLGALLVQLPPSLALGPSVAEPFFGELRQRCTLSIACEPRHSSWFTTEGEALLKAHHVSRVAADPAPVPVAAEPGGWPDLVYWRLHGSPRMYYSDYDAAALARMAVMLHASPSVSTWCVFDNTAASHAFVNALALTGLVADQASASSALRRVNSTSARVISAARLASPALR